MSGDNKTLVILTPGFAKDETDTTCIPMQQSFIKTLKQKYPHVEIIILAFEYPYSKGNYFWYDIPVLSFANRNKGGLSRLLSRQSIQKTLKRIHREKSIDGILSFWYGECAFIGNKFARRYKVQHLCWMWGQDAKQGNKYVHITGLEKDQIVVFSDFLQNEFERNYGITPAHVITPGIDVKEFPSINPQKDVDVLAAGSLIPLKRYDIFVEVIAEIKKMLPSLKAVLIGEGPERNKLEGLIESYDLRSTIQLTGELPHPQLLQWMQRAKLFLHPSSYEGFGIVSIEALCAGARVISFVRPMNKEIENWHIEGNKQHMIDRAIAILTHPRMNAQAVIPYTIEETVQKMSELFFF